MELFDIYNNNGSPAGYRATRAEVHNKGLLHKTVHVWVVNRQKEVLLQKRSLQKEVYPGFWDISCAGHVDAGENTSDAAVRELSEELGVKVQPERLQFLFSVKQQYDSENPPIHDHELTEVFLIHLDQDIDSYHINDSEVTALRFVSPACLTNKTIPDLAPHNEEYLLLRNILDSGL